MLMELTFKRKILKVFLHPPPPLERESFVKVIHLVHLVRHKTNPLSMSKSACENYLFEDYCLKSGMAI
jgi:hypothetical protein